MMEGDSNDNDNDNDYRVKLNVGGTTFTTFKSTLTSKSSYFYSRFAFYDNNPPTKKNDKTTTETTEKTMIFLDHSPEDFVLLLDYMRYGYLSASKITIKLLYLVDFLGMDDLILSMKCILIQNLYPKEVIRLLKQQQQNDDDDDDDVGVGLKGQRRTEKGNGAAGRTSSLETLCCNLFETKFGCSSITTAMQQHQLKHHVLLKHLRQDPSKAINKCSATQGKEFAHLIISEMGIFTPPYPTNIASTATTLHRDDADEEEEGQREQQQQQQHQQHHHYDDEQNFGSFLLNGLRRQLNEAATGVTEATRRIDSNTRIRNNTTTTATRTTQRRRTVEDDVLLRHYKSIKDCHVHLATFLYVPRTATVETSVSPSTTQGRQQQATMPRRAIVNQQQQQQEQQGGGIVGGDGGIIRRTEITTSTSNVSVAPAVAVASTSSATMQQRQPRLVGVLDCPSFLDGINRLHQLGFTTIEKGYNHIEDHSFAAAYLHPIYDHCWFSRRRRRRCKQQQKLAPTHVAQRQGQDVKYSDFNEEGEYEYGFSSPIVFDDDTNDMRKHEKEETNNIAENNDEERRQFAALINTGLDKDNKCNAFVLADVGRPVGGANSNNNQYLQFVDVYGNTGDRLQTNLTKISFANDHELLWWLDENGYTKKEPKISQIYEKIYQRGFKIGKGWRDDRVKKISVTVFSRKLII